MDTRINNANELKEAIIRLKAVEVQQAAALKQRFNSPSAIFHSVVSLFPKSPTGSRQGFFSQDIFGLLSRVLLPLTLNKTIFKNSNFLVKAAVGFVSQKASHLVNEQAVTGVWDKISSIFSKKKTGDHRIPPEGGTSVA